ncbi:MAG: GNAT family N-acetyltransferase [Opitutaceae bacterium]|nr:GNAT family N-acetyltransferase [Opitutaceae bacterium]
MAPPGKPSPLVRDAVAADLPAIVAIYNATIPGGMVTADTTPVTVEDRKSWFRTHTPDRRPIWVATNQSGAVCAWFSFSDFHSRPAYHPTAEISLYVAESSRRQGLGDLLLQRAIARAPALGLKVLVGLIWAHNEPSLRLCAKYGFERWGHLPRVALLHGLERDLIIVGRRVAA